RRAAAGRPTILGAVHSCTPSMAGRDRPWHAGVLYQRDARFAHALLEALRGEGDLVVGDTAPYRVSDATDTGTPAPAAPRRLARLELEIRQGLIADAAGQQAWAERLARRFTALQPRFAGAGGATARRPRYASASVARTGASTFSASNAEWPEGGVIT